MDILPVVININSQDEDNQVEATAVKSLKSTLGDIDADHRVDSITNQRYIIDANYDSFYLNPDLESLLNKRGFSTQRAEILGMFNYNAPLGKGTESESSDAVPYLITPSGELYDYQCQLKQMRYLDALNFFEKILGFSILETDGIKKLSSNTRGDNTHLSLERRREMLDNYEKEMTTASLVIDYLATIYNAISAFIEAQDISKKYLIFPEVADVMNVLLLNDQPDVLTVANASAIYSAIPSQDISIPLMSRITNENKISISALIEGYAKLSDASLENFKSNSGTAGLLNILNIVAASIIGLRSNTEHNPSEAYTKGKLIGTNSYTVDVPDILSHSHKFNLTEFDEIQVTDSEGRVYTQSQISQKLDGYDYAHTGLHTVASYSSTISYLIGLDQIQGYAYNNNSNLGNVAVGGGLSPSRFVSGLMGRDVSEDMTSILESLPSSNDQSMTRSIIAIDNDQTVGATRNAVEVFTSTNHDLADSTSMSRTGRSYYCDEIPTLEYDESVERVLSLKDQLGNLGKNLVGSVEQIVRKKSSTYLSKPVYQYGYQPMLQDVSLLPSTFYQYCIKSLKDSVEGLLERDICGDIHEDYLLSHIGAAIAAEDENFAYMVVGYNLAYYDYQSGTITKDEWDRVAEMLEFYICEKIHNDLYVANEAGEVSGDGHAVWYGQGSTPDGKIEHSEIYDHQAYNPSSMTSDYAFRPQGSEGQLIDQEGGRGGISIGADKDDVLSILNVFGGKLKNWGGDSTLNPPKNILLCPYHAMRRWKNDVGSSPSPRNISDTEKIIGAYSVMKRLTPRMIRATIYFQAETISRTYEDGKNDRTVSTTYLRALLGFNKRSLRSFVNAVDIFQKSGQAGSYTVDPVTLVATNSTVPLSIFDIAGFGAQDKWDHSSEFGYSNDIKYFVDTFKGVQKESVGKERLGFAAALLAARATDQLSSGATGLFQAINESSIEGQAYSEVLENIKDDPDFQKASLLGITRDQLTLNRALYDSIGSPNREYPYVPATKAIMTNQSKNLSGFFKLDSMLKSASETERFIVPVGLPAGLIESLRLRMMDKTGDVSYRYSNIVEVSIWKRDLLHEEVLFQPKRYVFDISKFIIEGRQSPTSKGSNLLDASVSALDPQNFNTALDKIVVRGYTPDGNIQTTTGKIDLTRYYSLDYGVDSNDIFKNHVIDSHLKTFMQLTTGFDVHEDIFPFLEGNVFFDGVDHEQEPVFKELSEKAKFMFVDRDIESALNYQRLIGELKRSILLSPKKYRNRIVYPKIFDRVFCMLVDPNSFSLVEGDFYKPVRPTNMGKFTQYYCTIAIKPGILSGEYQGLSEDMQASAFDTEKSLRIDSYIANNNSLEDVLDVPWKAFLIE